MKEDSVEAPANMAVMNNGQFTNNEESNDEAEGEEDVLRVIVDSDCECELTQNSVGTDETNIVAAVGVVVVAVGVMSIRKEKRTVVQDATV